MRSKVTTTRHVTAMPPQGIRNRPHSSSIEKGETVHVHFRESPMESKRRSPILILEKSQTGAHRRHISIPPQTPSYFLKGCRKGGGGEEELGLMTSESQGIEMEKMAVGSIHVYRDIGTQMTPPGSSGTSACPTPRPLAMPSGAVLRLDYARKDGLHTAPMRTPPHPSELGDTFCGHQEKLTKNCDTRKPKCGASLMRPSEEEIEERKVQKEEDEEEEDIWHCPRRSRENHNNKNNKSSHHDHDHDHNNNDNSEGVEKTTFKETFRAWEEAERARCIARSEREEARIQAWEEQKKSQALEKLKKLQIKVKKMQQKGEEKTTRKIMAAERQARQMRAATKAREAVALDKAKHHFMHSMKHQEQEQEQPQPQPQPQQRFSYCCCPWPHRKSLH